MAFITASTAQNSPSKHRIHPTDERTILAREEIEPLPEPSPNSQRNRLYQGVGMGFTYTNGWLLEIVPMMGYKFNKHISAGGLVNLRYVSSNLHTSNGTLYILNSVAAGAGTFLHLKLNDEFFVHTELSAINYELPIYHNGIAQYDLSSTRPLTERRFLPSLPVGVGYASSDALSFNMALFYDVMHSPLQNPIGSPWLIRLGFEQHF